MTWRAVLALALMVGGAVMMAGFSDQLRYLPETPPSETHGRLRAMAEVMGEDYGSVVREEDGERRLAERPQRDAAPSGADKPLIAVALDFK